MNLVQTKDLTKRFKLTSIICSSNPWNEYPIFIKFCDLYEFLKNGEFSDVGNIYTTNQDEICLSEDSNEVVKEIYEEIRKYLNPRDLDPIKNPSFSKYLTEWETEWKSQEIEENNLGCIREKSAKRDFKQEYNELTKDDKQRVDYFATMIQIITFIWKINKKYIGNTFLGNHELTEIYKYGPKLHSPRTESFNSMGFDYTCEFGHIITPIGCFHHQITLIGNRERDHEIIKRLEMINTLPKTYTRFGDPHGPFLSITKGLNGEQFEEAIFDKKDPSKDTINYWEEFWKNYRDLIFYRAMEKNDFLELTKEKNIKV